MREYLVTAVGITRLISADTEEKAVEIFIKEGSLGDCRYITRFKVAKLDSDFTNTFMINTITNKITCVGE